MAGKKGNVAARVEQLVRPAVEELGFTLWDVRFEKEGAEHFLKVLIDREEPMDTDACELASRAIDPLLDEADLIDQSYYLEVGSPGLGRRLSKPEHFAVMQGEEIYVKLYKAAAEGEKELRGTLGPSDAEGFSLQMEGRPSRRFTYKETALVKSTDDENLFG